MFLASMLTSLYALVVQQTLFNFMCLTTKQIPVHAVFKYKTQFIVSSNDISIPIAAMIYVIVWHSYWNEYISSKLLYTCLLKPRNGVE